MLLKKLARDKHSSLFSGASVMTFKKF